MPRYNHRKKNYGQRPSKRSPHTGFNPREVINTVESSDITPPKVESVFDDFLLSPKIKQNISIKGFKVPTPIQDQTIPEILIGKDVVGIANTGTGKTGAFLIPLLNRLLDKSVSRALIVAPTRELAEQINKEFVSFAQQTGIFSVVCIGGKPIDSQIYRLQKQPHLVIGTPGRLLDLQKRSSLDMRTFDAIVLDEVDRMLDMGFVHDIEMIISSLPSRRQSLFFSATINTSVEKIIQSFVKDPVKVTIKSAPTSANVSQSIIELNGREKREVLNDLLRQGDVSKALIFVRTKRGCDKLHRNLTKDGFKSTVLHGDKSQNQRQRSLQHFKQGRISIMIATDVASRGIDIHDISHVINHDLPDTYDDYIHRIGRTGRANNTGIALTFV